MEKTTWIPRRYIVAILAFFGFANIYALRVNLSVAIVAMTSNRTIVTVNGSRVVGPDFSWNSKVQGMVLSSFFYGYIGTQLFGGWLAVRYGGKRLFGLGILVTAAITVLTPALANTSLYCLVAGRIVEGLFEGMTYPAMHGFWSRWAPPSERSRLVTIAYSGSYFGTVAALPLSGALAEHYGWPSIFYVFGIGGLMWCVVWFVMVSETPASDKRMTHAERTYIEDSIGPYSRSVHINELMNLKRNSLSVHSILRVFIFVFITWKFQVPWRNIAVSLPVMAIVVAHFSENWGFYTLLTELPTYLTDVFGFNMNSAGLLAALPYLVMGIVVQSSGFLADWFITTDTLSTMQVRKLFTCSGFIIRSIFLLIAAHSVTPLMVVTCLTLAVGFGGFAFSGFSVNHLDIAPQYASILMGISNTVATLPGIVSPLLTGHIVQHKSAAEWQTVLHISAGIYVIGAIVYAMLGSGKQQSWAVICAEQGFLASDNDLSQSSTEDLVPVASAATHYKSTDK